MANDQWNIGLVDGSDAGSNVAVVLVVVVVVVVFTQGYPGTMTIKQACCLSLLGYCMDSVMQMTLMCHVWFLSSQPTALIGCSCS